MRENTQTFETFAGGSLDPQNWELLETPIGEGKTHIVQEPQAQITVAGAALEIKVDCFQNFGDIPTLDNPKHMYVSRKYFPLPPDRISTPFILLHLPGFTHHRVKP